MRIFLKVVLAILVVFVGAIVLLAAVGWYTLRNPDRYLPNITAYMQQKSGLQIQIRHIAIRLRPTLLVTLYGLQVENPTPFPAGDFLNVPRLDADVEIIPLLHKQVEVRSLVLDHPVIDFISDPDGLWNFQNPSSSRQQPARFSMGVIQDLQIKNGTLLGSNLIDPADTPGPVVLTLSNFSANLKQIDLGKANPGGASQTVEGNLAADKARFGVIHTTELHSDLRITPKLLTFSKFSTKTHSGHAAGDFSLNFGAKNTVFQTTLKVSGIGMPYLLAEFQQGPPTMTGMMQADFALAGEIKHTSNPLAGIHGRGNFSIHNGELPGLNRNKNMIQMKRFRDKGTAALAPSAFSTFAGDMDLRNQRMYSSRIGVNFYGIDID